MRSTAVPATEAITSVLLAHREGRPGAFDQLVGLVYPELRKIARGQLGRWRPGQSLDTGALVHEVYLKLVDQTRVNWQDRHHFFAIAARSMRQVIIDYARRRQTQKRGGGEVESLGSREIAVQAQADQLLEMNDLLSRLEAEDPRLLQVVECRFFAGYSEAETAATLGVSTRTVERDWLRARAWLRGAMTAAGAAGRRTSEMPAGGHAGRVAR
jgi:RNA polymerase sigma factor (TIGR02999 family)